MELINQMNFWILLVLLAVRFQAVWFVVVLVLLYDACLLFAIPQCMAETDSVVIWTSVDWLKQIGAVLMDETYFKP